MEASVADAGEGPSSSKRSKPNSSGDGKRIL